MKNNSQKTIYDRYAFIDSQYFRGYLIYKSYFLYYNSGSVYLA